MGTADDRYPPLKPDAQQALFEAALRSCNLNAAVEIVDRRVDVNRRTADGRTPLMIAASLGHVLLATLLLEAGADVMAIEPNMGASALHKAAQAGSCGVIKLLLDHGAFIDQQSPVLGNTPLIDAVLHERLDAVRLLLQRGARTCIGNHWQQTAIVLARRAGTNDLAGLIEARDAADAACVAGLHLLAAAKAGDVDEVLRLVEEDAVLDGHLFADERAPAIGTLDDLYTPLGIATREGHAEVVRILLAMGLDPLEPIGLMGGTSVHEASSSGRAGIVRLFTGDTGADDALVVDLDDQRPYDGFTALHAAVVNGHIDVVQALIAASARCDLRTHTGLTPHRLALLHGYDDIARFLEEAGGG